MYVCATFHTQMICVFISHELFDNAHAREVGTDAQFLYSSTDAPSLMMTDELCFEHCTYNGMFPPVMVIKSLLVFTCEALI